MALGINIVSSFDGRGIEKAIKEFQKLKTNGERAQFAVQKAALPAAAALAGLGFAAVKATQAAMQEAQEMATLASTLQRVTGASQATIDANEQFLASMQRATIYSDSEMRPALASLVQGSGDLARSQQDLQLAMDIATATSIPLVQVADALSKSYNDNFKSLKALSPALNDNIKSGQSLDQIFAELNATFGGATAAATDTAAGKMKQLQNQLSDLQESIGLTLLPIVEKIVPVFAGLASAVSNNQTTFLVIAGTIAAFSAVLVAAGTAVKLHTLYLNLMKIEIIKTSGVLKAAGIATAGFVSALSGLMIAQVLAPLINNLSGATGRAEDAFKKTGAALNDFNNDAANSEEVLRNFVNVAQAELQKFKPTEYLTRNPLQDWGREFQLVAGEIKIDIEVLDKTFKQFADSSPAYAQSIVNAMKAQLAITDPTTRAYRDLQDAIARYEKQLDTAKAAQDAFNGAVANTPRVIPLTGALARLEGQTQREFWTRQQSADALDDWNTKARAAFESARSGASSVQTAKEKLEAFTGALRANYDAQRSLTSAQEQRISANKALDTAIATTTKAQINFNSVVRGFARDSKQAVDATRRYDDAQKRLRDTNLRLQDATLNQHKAEKELQRLRELTADPESVAAAERNVERAKYGVEEANFAVIEAEQNLADLRASGASAVEVRRAEIALAEAKFRVSESALAVRDAEKDLFNQQNRSASPEELAQAERDVERAKIDVENATIDVADATKEAADAQDIYNQTLNGATEETQMYKDALLELNTAKADEAIARKNVASAILAEADATLSLKDAAQNLRTTRGNTPADLVSRGMRRLSGIATDNPALSMLNQPTSMEPFTPPMNVTVNAGIGADADSIARGLIDIFKQYERANGYIPITAEAVAG